MEGLFNHLLALLGETPQDGLLRQLIHYLNEEPRMEFIESGDNNFLFPHSGIICYTYKSRICSFSIEIDSFKGDLPNGITSQDTSSDVKGKLGLEPCERYTRKSLIEKYDMKTHYLMFAFDLNDGRILSIHVNTKALEPSYIKSYMRH